MKKHLAVFSKTAIKQIFSGKRGVEIRFSLRRVPPFETISVGDLVYIKPPGEDIVGRFLVKKVIFIEGVEVEDQEWISTFFNRRTSLKDKTSNQKYFSRHKNAKYASLIFFDAVEQFIVSPIKIPKKDSRGWIVLE